MDTVYMFEAAVPLFTTFYERYYAPGEELDNAIPNHRAITKASLDGLFLVCFDFIIIMFNPFLV